MSKKRINKSMLKMILPGLQKPHFLQQIERLEDLIGDKLKIKEMYQDVLKRYEINSLMELDGSIVEYRNMLSYYVEMSKLKRTY